MVKPYQTDLSAEYHRNDSAVRLSRLLDSAIPLPGGFRIGLDGILGLIPGVGDAIGGFLSLLILHEAYKRRVPKMILLRMLLNVLIDAVIGSVPVLGDIFDFFWKANSKNVQLLEDYDYAPKKTYRKSTVVSALLLAGVTFCLLVLAWLAWQLAQFLWNAITAI